MTIMERMGTREVAMESTITVEKVVLVALWLVVIMMLPPLAMEMMYLVMLLKKNQLRKFPTKEYNFKTIHILECQL